MAIQRQSGKTGRQYSHARPRRQSGVAALRRGYTQWIQWNAQSSARAPSRWNDAFGWQISFAHALGGLNRLELRDKFGYGTALAPTRWKPPVGGYTMIKSRMLVAAASLALVSMHGAADNRPLETRPVAPSAASAMSDADLLAERHLALYRVSRASVLGLRDSAEDSVPVSVRTAATAPLPLPLEQPRPGTEFAAQ
ncbi:MAG: hypothetical protein ACT4PS_05885 [Betaproteobacteria bacterium]